MDAKLGKKVVTIGILAIILVVLVVVIGAKKDGTVKVEGNGGIGDTKEEYVEKLEDGSKLNVSEELKKTKTLDGLEITNIQLKETGGITTLLAEVENKTKAKIGEKMVAIDVLNKRGEKITTVKGIVDEVNPGEKVQLNISVTADVANAYDFKISGK